MGAKVLGLAEMRAAVEVMVVEGTARATGMVMCSWVAVKEANGAQTEVVTYGA